MAKKGKKALGAALKTASTLLTYQYKKDQEFNLRLLEAGIKEPIKGNKPIYTLDPKSGELIFEGYVPYNAKIFKSSTEKSFSGLSPVDAQTFLSSATPGTPLPPENLPGFLSPAGAVTMNRAIQYGITETPAAVPINEAIPEQFPLFFSDRISEKKKPSLFRQIGSAIPETAGSFLAPLVQPYRIARSIMERPRRVSQPTPPLERTESLLSDARIARQQGYRRKEVMKELIAMGTNPELAERIVDQAGF